MATINFEVKVSDDRRFSVDSIMKIMNAINDNIGGIGSIHVPESNKNNDPMDRFPVSITIGTKHGDSREGCVNMFANMTYCEGPDAQKRVFETLSSIAKKLSTIQIECVPDDDTKEVDSNG